MDAATKKDLKKIVDTILKETDEVIAIMSNIKLSLLIRLIPSIVFLMVGKAP